MKTVVCYGDSNTYGYKPDTGGRYPKGKRWPILLQKMLGDDYDVIPEGLNGRTTAYDREDPWKNGLTYLVPCLNSCKPIDVLIFMLGTNDCNWDLHLSADDIASGMELLIKTSLDACKEFQEKAPEILIIVPAAILPDYQDSPFADQLDDESVKKSQAIAPLYKKIAEKYGCLYLDCSNSIPVSTIDSEHLTEEGHSLLAGKVYEIIKDL